MTTPTIDTTYQQQQRKQKQHQQQQRQQQPRDHHRRRSAIETLDNPPALSLTEIQAMLRPKYLRDETTGAAANATTDIVPRIHRLRTPIHTEDDCGDLAHDQCFATGPCRLLLHSAGPAIGNSVTAVLLVQQCIAAYKKRSNNDRALHQQKYLFGGCRHPCNPLQSTHGFVRKTNTSQDVFHSRRLAPGGRERAHTHTHTQSEKHEPNKQHTDSVLVPCFPNQNVLKTRRNILFFCNARVNALVTFRSRETRNSKGTINNAAVQQLGGPTRDDATATIEEAVWHSAAPASVMRRWETFTFCSSAAIAIKP